jgi:hypothetical protein
MRSTGCVSDTACLLVPSDDPSQVNVTMPSASQRIDFVGFNLPARWCWFSPTSKSTPRIHPVPRTGAKIPNSPQHPQCRGGPVAARAPHEMTAEREAETDGV